MSKPKLELNDRQVKELKWFCDNVTGLRKDFYEVYDLVASFDKRIKRLEKTCELIEKHLNEEGETK
jgi:hypothetical protein